MDVWYGAELDSDSTRKYVLITQCVESKPPFINIDNWETAIGSIETFLVPVVLFDSPANILMNPKSKESLVVFNMDMQNKNQISSMATSQDASLWGELIWNYLGYYCIIWFEIDIF